MGEDFSTEVRTAEEEVCFQLCGSSIGYLQEQEGVEWSGVVSWVEKN